MANKNHNETANPQTARILTTDLNEWQGEMQMADYGAVLICRSGSAEVHVNFREWDLHEGSVLTVFPGDIVGVREKEQSFEVEMLQYSASLLREASLQMEQTVYSSLREDRCRRECPMVTHIVDAIFSLLKLYFGQPECQCLSQLVLLQLKSFFIGFHDYLLRNPQYRPDEGTSKRVRDLFNEFMRRVEADCKEAREVNYYASLMNITPKYLTTIVRQVTGHTPKEIIDHYVILQLKLHMKLSQQNLKEIAWEYHFSDVSFFCRYFKKHTGKTPQEFRG